MPAVPTSPVASDLFVNNISADCDGADCQFHIPTVVTDRRRPCQRVNSRRRCLRAVKLSNGGVKDEDELPSLFIVNPTSLAKNNAKQLLATDVASCNADIVLVSETWFKTHHNKVFSSDLT